MRILQITNKAPFPEKDGGAIACMNLLRGFAGLGNEVTVLTMSTLKHPLKKQDIPPEITALADFRIASVPAPVSATGALKNLLFSKLPYNAERFICINFESALVKLLSEKEFDVVQLEGLYVCPYIPVIRKHSKALVVYRAHNIEHEIWERTAKLSKGLKKIYLGILSRRLKRFETSWLNSYDVLVPITARDGQILDKAGNRKPRFVSQTGIDTSKLFPDSSRLEYPSVFHIGSLEWAPNQEGLIWFIGACWPQILKKFPSLKFYIAGRNAPQWLIKKLEAQNVVFLGEIDDAYAFMNSKSIMVVPLFSGSGMRIKIIEGLALGKTIVSTPIGTEGIETENGKNILVADTPEMFSEAVCKLAEDKNLSDTIGANAIRFIHEKFNNLAIAGQLAEFYKNQPGWF